MATSQPPVAPANGNLPPAVLGEFHRLTQKQNTEKNEFYSRVKKAESQLIERHANEQREFWARHPQGSGQVVAAAEQPGGVERGGLASAADESVPPSPHNMGNQPSKPAKMQARPQQQISNNTVNGLATPAGQRKSDQPSQQMGRPMPIPPMTARSNAAPPSAAGPPTRSRTCLDCLDRSRMCVWRETEQTCNACKKNKHECIPATTQEIRQAEKACDQCRTSRLKCDGYEPCIVCKDKGRVCGGPAKPALNPKPQPGSLLKSQKQPEIIDLSISDEETEPQAPCKKKDGSQREVFVPPVANRTMNIFGNNNESFRQQIKHGEDESTQGPPPRATSFVASSVSGYTSAPQYPMHALPMSPKSTQSNGTLRPWMGPMGPARPKKPIPLDQNTQFSHEALIQQRNDRSSILREPASLPKDPYLHSLQQQQKDGAFVKNVLHNGRAQNWAPELRKSFEQRSEDTPMDDAPVRAQAAYTSGSAEARIGPSSQQSDVVSPATQGHISSPRLSAPQTSTQFKIPVRPGSGDTLTTAERMRREGTVTSRASSQTSGREAAELLDKFRTHKVPLPTPPQSKISSIRKRKAEHNLSSDSDEGDKRDDRYESEESDHQASEFAPSSDDDKPLLPKEKKKAADASGSTKRAFGPSKKNPFGFTVPTKPPLTPPVAKTITPATPGPSSRKVARPSSPESPSVRAASRLNRPHTVLEPTRPSQRRAKVLAQARLEEQARKDAEFRTGEQIREADELDARLGRDPYIGARMRNIIITPAPRSNSNSGSEGSVYDGARWTRDRKRGDRELSRSLAGSAPGRGNESGSEADASKYQYVKDGVIVETVEEMDLTGC